MCEGGLHIVVLHEDSSTCISRGPGHSVGIEPGPRIMLNGTSEKPNKGELHPENSG
jgi:hypothetical protein